MLTLSPTKSLANTFKTLSCWIISVISLFSGSGWFAESETSFSCALHGFHGEFVILLFVKQLVMVLSHPVTYEHAVITLTYSRCLLVVFPTGA